MPGIQDPRTLSIGAACARLPNLLCLRRGGVVHEAGGTQKEMIRGRNVAARYWRREAGRHDIMCPRRARLWMWGSGLACPCRPGNSTLNTLYGACETFAVKSMRPSRESSIDRAHMPRTVRLTRGAPFFPAPSIRQAVRDRALECHKRIFFSFYFSLFFPDFFLKSSPRNFLVVTIWITLYTLARPYSVITSIHMV